MSSISELRYVTNFEWGRKPRLTGVRNCLYSLQISKMKERISNGEFGAIVKNQELFWQAYCLAYVESKQEHIPSYSSVGISGQADIYHEMRECVEIIRHLFHRNWGNTFHIIPIGRFGTCHFRSTVPRRILNLSLKVSDVIEEHFNMFIWPVLPTLCDLLNFSSREVDVGFNVKLILNKSPEFETYTALEITVNRDEKMYEGRTHVGHDDGFSDCED